MFHPLQTGAISDQVEPSTDPTSNLLLHCNGTDGSTTFTDSSTGLNSPHTITANGDAQIDTAQKKFGTGSLITDGNGDYLSCAGGSDYAMGTGDYTVDFWLYDASLPSSTDALYATTTSGGISCTFTSTQINIGRSLVASDFSVNHSLSTSTWYHIAIVRASGTTDIYQDGTSLGNSSLGNNYPSSGSLLVGIDGNGTAFPSSVQIDEFRVIKGTAVWTANFTPPTSEYTN